MSLRANKHQQFAKDALTEFSDGSFGKFISEKEIEKGIFDVRFEATARGYQGWHWVVTITQPEDPGRRARMLEFVVGFEQVLITAADLGLSPELELSATYSVMGGELSGD